MDLDKILYDKKREIKKQNDIKQVFVKIELSNIIILYKNA